MTRFLLSLFFALALISLEGCLKCKGEAKNEGIIVGNAPEICYWWPYSEHTGKFVIASKQELDSLNVLYNMTCDSTQAIDFNSYSILGFMCTGSCHMKCNKKVERDDASSKYYYTVTSYDCGCWTKQLQLVPNIVLVPKLPNGYTVDFILKED